MKADLRVAICTPTTGINFSGFTWSTLNLIKCFLQAPNPSGTHDCEPIIVRGSILPDQRQRCIAEASRDEFDATHILWLDDDMRVPHDAIQALLRHDLPVVGANYPRCNMQAIPTAYRDDDEFTGPVYTRDESEGLEQVKHMGFGCLLTAMWVFDQLDLPYFNFDPVHNGARFRGEDVYFFRKLKEAGISAYLDHDVSKKCAHIGVFEYTNEVAVKADDARMLVLRGKQAEALRKDQLGEVAA